MLRALVLLAALASAAAQAQSPLESVADALGGADRLDAVETIRTQLTTRTRLAGRAVTIRSTVSVRLPDAGRWDVRLGAGTRSVVVRGDSVLAPGAGSSRVGDADARRARQGLWLDPVVLAARRSEVRGERLGPKLLRLTVPTFPEPVLLRLDADGRPALLSTFRDGSSQPGSGREYLEVRYSDYRVVDGVAIPHRVAQAVAGAETGVSTVRAVRVNAELGPATFAR